ncbi:hypothetical protein Ae201684P_002149 [Aphanomyces euteiches]|uniref:Serine protease n=1 Tax=Aphanomyces euteiches TaxID=100861 RepID=A0A6G0XJZ4_9STRA|nr:hypothetical protein Ae201684_004005 [Aphanomyces euteiches]KAH9084917.1 hypothetical protein Ae201684P_002149 [Aphanomyces euteiches]KAH9138630.1 hypothetical protein AeRB84_017039 [Aphanomyces euteiches]
MARNAFSTAAAVAMTLLSVLGTPTDKVLAVVSFPVHIGCSTGATPYVFPVATTPSVVFSMPVHDPAAEFISFNVTALDLPPRDYIQVRPLNASAPVYTYRGHYPDGILTTALFAQDVVFELISFGSTNSNCEYGVSVADYRFSATPPAHESTCDTTDDANSPACNRLSVYWQGSQAVVRLLINTADGARWCSGWLVGCENHVLTNHHCIASEEDAAATTFDIQAYGKCHESCIGGGSCSAGNVVVGSTLIASSATLDYALVQLASPTATSTFLQLQPTTPVGGRIYIPQYAYGAGMVVAIKTNSKYGLLETSTYSNKDCGLDGMVGYRLNTSPGSSGSPVISTTTNGVVAMHSCGGCSVVANGSLNGGIAAGWIVQDLQAKNALPKCALAPQPPSDGVVEYTSVRGTLYRHARGVTMDVHMLSLDSDGVLELDLLSYEKTSDGVFVDVDNNCDASYFDSKVYLVASDGSIIGVNDNSVHGNGRADGSVNDLDAFLTFNVDPGQYFVVVGTTDMSDTDAELAVTQQMLYSAGGLMECGLSSGSHGHYTLTIRTNIDPESISAFVPTTSAFPSACDASSAKAQAPSTCPSYHQVPALNVPYIVDGTIVQTNETVSIDQVPFELLEATHLSIEVVSFQALDDGSILPEGFDDQGFCGRTYIDAVAYVFEDTTANQLKLIDTGKLIAACDDKAPGFDTPSGLSRSSRDPFLDLFLLPGKYVLVVGQYPLKLQDAPRSSVASTPGFYPWRQGVPSSTGTYHVVFSTTRAGILSPPCNPPSFIPESCSVATGL